MCRFFDASSSLTSCCSGDLEGPIGEFFLTLQTQRMDEPQTMKSFLLISPYFPPMGISGAKRALHLCRNLPERGWRPVVLAAQIINERLDPDLEGLIPSETVVSYGIAGRLRPWLKAKRAAAKPKKTRRPRAPAKASGFPHIVMGVNVSYLTPFDRFLWDIPSAIREGLRLIKSHQLEAIHVSADPWSGLLIAYCLHRLTGLPLIPDLRDPWSLHEGKVAMRPAPSRWLLRRVEATVFQAASKVILNSELSRAAYAECYRSTIEEARFTTIRNAFDPDIFREGEPEKSDVFTLLYFGRFRLFVGPEQLLLGFKRFVESEGLSPAQVRFRFVGGLRPQDDERIAAMGIEKFIDRLPPVSLRDCLPVLQSADVLTFTVEPGCRLQIPGKLYDYMAARRPILAVSANPEVDAILDETGAGVHAPFDDPDAIAAQLGGLYHRRGEESTVSVDAIEPYSARAQARRFADVLDEVTSQG